MKYLSESDRARGRCLNRDKYICQRCKKRFPASKLQVHHKDYRENPEQLYSLSNLITYCKKCHARIHADAKRYVPPAIRSKQKKQQHLAEYMKRPMLYRRLREEITARYCGGWPINFAKLRKCAEKHLELDLEWGFYPKRA